MVSSKRTNALIAGGFTLIELIIAIAVSVMIIGVLYFALKSALDSWQTSQDQLMLQQVSSNIMEELTEGMPDTYGLRDALEIANASSQQVSVVMPWTDNTHDVFSGINLYTLNKYMKPGTGLPITEALLPETREYKAVPVILVDQGKSDDRPVVRLKIDVPAGSHLRFTFHPDYKKDAGVLSDFRFDESENAIFIDNDEGSNEISQNNFGIKITNFLIRYYDNTNTELGVGGNISNDDIPMITGLEIAFKAESKNKNTRETVSFVSLRNAPMCSGNFTLKEGSRFPIPNSKDIKAFFLTNLSGIRDGDTIVLDAKPESGKDWLLTVNFSRPAGSNSPMIDNYTIEYPSGNRVYSDKPRIPADNGLSLLGLGINGLYDYDDDNMNDTVRLEGKVMLEVKKMEIQGASVFVRP